jgi:hypothetical protein
MALVPCPSCARHVRHDAEQCPFCGAPLTPATSVSERIDPSMVSAYGIAPVRPLPAPAYGLPAYRRGHVDDVEPRAPRRWPLVLGVALGLLVLGAALYTLGQS